MAKTVKIITGDTPAPVTLIDSSGQEAGPPYTVPPSREYTIEVADGFSLVIGSLPCPQPMDDPQKLGDEFNTTRSESPKRKRTPSAKRKPAG